MVRVIRPKLHAGKRRKRAVEKPQETTAQLQARLQRAVDHGWQPKEALPDGVTLNIPSTGLRE